MKKKYFHGLKSYIDMARQGIKNRAAFFGLGN